MSACTHLDQIREVTPSSADGCEDCLSCGYVGCCDSSPNRHASKHAHDVSHPIVRSFEPGEDWRWCYQDEVFV
jgi:hypothetical protein